MVICSGACSYCALSGGRVAALRLRLALLGCLVARRRCWPFEGPVIANGSENSHAETYPSFGDGGTRPDIPFHPGFAKLPSTRPATSPADVGGQYCNVDVTSTAQTAGAHASCPLLEKAQVRGGGILQRSPTASRSAVVAETMTIRMLERYAKRCVQEMVLGWPCISRTIACSRRPSPG